MPLEELIDTISSFEIPVKAEDTARLPRFEFLAYNRFIALQKFVLLKLSELSGESVSKLQLDYEKMLYEILKENASDFLGKRGTLP